MNTPGCQWKFTAGNLVGTQCSKNVMDIDNKNKNKKRFFCENCYKKKGSDQIYYEIISKLE
jgi:hypothetical protein